MSKLELIDDYISERKRNKENDLLALLVISVKIMYSTDFERKNYFKNLGGKLAKPNGYDTAGFSNQDYGYYYITRCYSEKIFNMEMFGKNLKLDLGFVGTNPAPKNNTHPKSISSITKKLKDIYQDFLLEDNKHYYYDIAFDDHTFLIAKYNNNFRIIQSWMLKYQLENVVFNNDIHNCFPKFITLLFINQYYLCMSRSINLITMVRNVFDCNNLQAKQYINEFKYMYCLIFSKELHINGNTFNLHVELNSDKYLCQSFDINVRIKKHEFEPDKVLQTYQKISFDALRNEIKKYPALESFYRTKLGVQYPFYNINQVVNINDNIRQILNYHIYPYLIKDHHYDSQHLNFMLKNYNIQLDSKNYFEKLIKTALAKYQRNTKLIKMRNSRISNKTETVLQIYKTYRMEKNGGQATSIYETNSTLPNLANLANLAKLAETNTTNLTKSQLANLTKLAVQIIPILSQKKIEVFDLYKNYIELMSSTEDKLTNNKIYIPFDKLNLTEVLNTTEKQNATMLYEQTKNNIIMEITNHIKVTLQQLLGKLDISEQLVTIVKLYLVEPELQPVLSEFINNSKREVFDLVSEILSKNIISGFYNQSYSQQKIALEGFNLIEVIVSNKTEILEVLTGITFSLPDEINQIRQYQFDITNVKENKFSDKIIVNYMLPIISGKPNNEKIQTLMGINLNTHDTTGIKYVNSLLDNEIIFSCPKETLA